MRLLTVVCLLLAVARFAHAQEAVGRFRSGATELELLGGAMFSIDSGTPSKPTINTAIQAVRFGIMVTNPREHGAFAGNTEILFEGLGGEIFTGPGNGLASLAGLLRRNWFLRPGLVGYAQFGGGGSYSDIADRQDQALLGTNLNFTAEGALGFKFLLGDRCTFLLEHDFIHFSNAGTSHRNHGLNSLGALAGVSFAF